MIFILSAEDLDAIHQKDVLDLYKSSFPANERDSIHRFLLHDGGEGRILTFCDGGVFIGFSALIVFGDIVNILYLAVKPDFQGHGYGHQILEMIKTMYPAHRFIVDIEKDEEQCPNHMMRKRRELFYLHDDYAETDIAYTYKGMDYVILSANGKVTKEEFKAFWSHFAKVDDLGHFIAAKYQVK